MGRLFVEELRGLVERWQLWIPVVLVGVLGWAMLPVNADAYLTYINFDPQGVDQLWDNYRTDVWAVYTSGLGWAQLLAMMAGGFLVLRDPRLTGRAATPVAPADPGPVMVAKAAAAALYGLILAVADLVVVLPNAHAHLAGHWTLAQLGNEGGAVVHQLTLADGSVWTVLLCAAAGVPMFGAIGVGLAARAGRWWLIGGIGALLVLASALFLAQDRLPQSGGAAEATVTVLFYVVALPAGPWALLWYMTLSPWAPLGLALTLVVAVAVFLFGYDATRRRLSRRNATPAIGQT